MSPNDADGMANSVDPDQTAPPLGAVWSGSPLFAQAYLSKNLVHKIKSLILPITLYFNKLLPDFQEDILKIT